MPAYAPGALCLILIAALSVRTWFRNADWKDDLSIATASVEASPGSFKTHDLLANVLYASDPAHANIDRVIAESEKSLAILDPLPYNRSVPDPYQLAGTCYLYRGDLLRQKAPQGSLPQESLLSYEKAIAALLRFLLIEKAEFAEFQNKLKPGGPSPKSAEHITDVRQGDAYTLLSIAYLRSGDSNSAADAAVRARALNPLSSQLYRQRAEIALAAGRTDGAASTLIEGAFVMSDGSLRQRLVEVYQHTLPGSCALKPGPRGLALNPACPLVHSNICSAAAGTIQTLEGAGQNELAQTRKKMFAEEFGCTLP
jgi:tetratricopeptide (TPR) repeat protein